MQRLGAANHIEADVVAQQRIQLEAQVALEQRHQRGHFRDGTLPVLNREGVEREDVDAETCGRFDDVANGLDPRTMSLHTREVALRRPPSIAVHDDRDMAGQTVEVDLPGQRFLI